MSRGLSVESCAVRVSKATKAALVEGASNLMRASGQVSHIGALVDDLVAEGLQGLIRRRLDALQHGPPPGAAGGAVPAARAVESGAGSESGAGPGGVVPCGEGSGGGGCG